VNVVSEDAEVNHAHVGAAAGAIERAVDQRE
jgi:hypothetical protein